MSGTRIVFLDTETTGLGQGAEIWEIGAIVRDPGEPDREFAWRLRPLMYRAEPTGLRIGRFYERMTDILGPDGPEATVDVHPALAADETGEQRRTTIDRVAVDVAQLLDGAIIVGAVPNFDTERLDHFLRDRNLCGSWHYHLVDVETLAAGLFGMAPPWNFDSILTRLGLTYDEASRHTALGDARMVRDAYDAVMVTDKVKADADTADAEPDDRPLADAQ